MYRIENDVVYVDDIFHELQDYDKLEFTKDPVVAEFLGFSQNTDFTESDLEKSIRSQIPEQLKKQENLIQT